MSSAKGNASSCRSAIRKNREATLPVLAVAVREIEMNWKSRMRNCLSSFLNPFNLWTPSAWLPNHEPCPRSTKHKTAKNNEGEKRLQLLQPLNSAPEGIAVQALGALHTSPVLPPANATERGEPTVMELWSCNVWKCQFVGKGCFVCWKRWCI